MMRRKNIHCRGRSKVGHETKRCESGAGCHVLALDRTTGAIIWDKEVFRQTPGHKQQRNGYATPTPCTDGDRIYAVFGDGSFVALDSQGNTVWLNRFGKDGRVMRVVFRGSNQTITGREVLLTSDLPFQTAAIRLALLEFSLGKPPSPVDARTQDINIGEAIRRFKAGVKITNLDDFESKKAKGKVLITRKGTKERISGWLVRLSTDL
jgi:hypothetical protein